MPRSSGGYKAWSLKASCSRPCALHRVGGASLALSWALSALLVGFEGARFGVVAYLTACAFSNGWLLLLAFPVSLVTAEFLYPMFFPSGSWLFVHRIPLLLQTAELGGPLTVTLWIGVVNAGRASAWLARSSDRSGRMRVALAVPGLTLGAVIVRDAKGRWPTAPQHRFNSAVLADPDGTVRGIYDKQELVPLGETMPGGETLPWLRRLMPTAGDFTAGSSSAPLAFANRRILVSICYEDILPDAMREALGRAEPTCSSTSRAIPGSVRHACPCSTSRSRRSGPSNTAASWCAPRTPA